MTLVSFFRGDKFDMDLQTKLYDELFEFLSQHDSLIELHNNIVYFEKNSFIVTQYNRVKYIYILLEGKASVEDSTIRNNESENFIEYISPIHFIGLIELLNSKKIYTASVVTQTDCNLLKIDSNLFVKLLKKNSKFCFLVLKIFGMSTLEHMYNAKSNIVLPKEQLVGFHLYNLAQKNSLPYTYPYTRDYLSRELSINIRTLYRYIDLLKENQLIEIHRGSIVITKSNIKLMDKYYKNISYI